MRALFRLAIKKSGTSETHPTKRLPKLQQFMYFQLRCLPSAIHSTAVANRLARVSSRLASLIQSTYSRCALGLKAA